MQASDNQVTVDADFQKIIDKHGKFGMEIIPVNSLATAETIRTQLELEPHHFAVCGFMGASAGKLPVIQQVARDYAKTLVNVSKKYNLDLVPLSGGGTWKGHAPSITTGIMGWWAYGATRDAEQMSRFITMRGLVEFEGLPLEYGKALCLMHDGIGQRGDGLLGAGNFFSLLPGGWGSRNEDSARVTNHCIVPAFKSRKAMLADPMVTNPVTGKTGRFWEHYIADTVHTANFGLIAEKKLIEVNENTLIYQPRADISAEEMTRDLVTLTVATRAEAHNYDPKSGFRRIDNVVGDIMAPLSEGSIITDFFDYGVSNGNRNMPAWCKHVIHRVPTQG